MNNFLIPHPPATIEQMESAVIAWRKAAEHERFRTKHNLCSGWNMTAIYNAELYEKTARDIEKEIEIRKSQDVGANEMKGAASQSTQLGLQFTA